MSHEGKVEQTTESTAEQSALTDHDLESVAGGKNLFLAIPETLDPPIIITCPVAPIVMVDGPFLSNG